MPRSIIRAGALASLSLAAGILPVAAQAHAQAQAQARFSYAAAMTHHKPLARIAGRPAPMAHPGRDDPRFARAVAYAEEMESYSLLIWQGGKLRTERYFAPHTPDLKPESASMHKSVLALLVTAAIADGKIASVDDPVAKYVPEWAGDARGAITLRQILTMSAGLSVPDQASMGDGEKARAAVLGMQPIAAPGAHFAYSNALSQVLLMVLEKSTGTPYAQYLSQRLWSRIGADDAFVWNYEPQGFPRGHSALMARATDWLRLGLLIKDRGRAGSEQVIPAAMIDQMTAPSETNPNYGWQIWRGATWSPKRFYNDAGTGFSVTQSAPYAIEDLLYFDGFGGQRVYVSRALDLVIVRQGALRTDWDDAQLPNRVAQALK